MPLIDNLLLAQRIPAAEAQRYVLLGAAMKESKTSPDKIVVGFAWYRPEQWQRIRDISSDADTLENSYEEWLSLAERKIKELGSSGVQVEKVDVDSEQLILWCNERGLEMNAQARSRYAVEKLQELHGDQP